MFNVHCSILIGWVCDLVFGDPQRLPHPIVWFGKVIAFFEHRLNHGSHRRLKGALVSVSLIVCTFALTWFLRFSIFNFQSSILFLFDSLIIFFCLAGTTLIREVRAVFLALDRSLEEGRAQVARIVGRDTSELTAQEVRTAALETLAENLSDGVIAPLFWLALLGTPGMLAYKMVNTLDSMIGYKTERYKDFGCWAAHIDDVANYLPARLTALLMVLPYAIFNFQFSISSVVTAATMLRPTAATPKLPSQASWIVVSEALITISANYSPSPTLAIIHENLPLPTCASPSV